MSAIIRSSSAINTLIEQLRGTVMVKSDRGTVWTIRFPTAVAAVA